MQLYLESEMARQFCSFEKFVTKKVLHKADVIEGVASFRTQLPGDCLVQNVKMLR